MRNLEFRELFLSLCSMTTPTEASEGWVWNHIPRHGDDLVWVDGGDNFNVIVLKQDGSEPNTMFSSHCDTADSYPTFVNFKFEHEDTKDFVKTDGNSILGADCKIGVAIMIKMIEARVPGWYVFHSQEESGCLGSGWLKSKENKWLLKPNKCVAFDRRDYDSIVTHQCGSRTASDEFAEALAECLDLSEHGYNKMEPDPTGMFTDSYEYENCIPECTNISVGYFNQHTNKECQDITFAELLLQKCIATDWESLPVHRDPNDVDDDDFYFGRGWYVGHPHKQTRSQSSVVFTEDDECISTLDNDDYGFDPAFLTEEEYETGRFTYFCEHCGHEHSIDIHEPSFWPTACEQCGGILDLEGYKDAI